MISGSLHNLNIILKQRYKADLNHISSSKIMADPMDIDQDEKIQEEIATDTDTSCTKCFYSSDDQKDTSIDINKLEKCFDSSLNQLIEVT